MKRMLLIAGPTAALAVCWLTAQPAAQPAGDPLLQGLREVEVASVSDAMEQLYGQQAFMSHEMRPLSPAKFAGPAVTVLMKKEEHKEGSAASQGMLDAIDKVSRDLHDSLWSIGPLSTIRTTAVENRFSSPLRPRGKQFAVTNRDVHSGTKLFAQ